MNYNWNEIFAQGERFNKAAELLNQMDDGLKIVSFTNAAFAIELYYKALYLKSTGNDPSKANHDLITIFESLPKSMQNEIQADFNSEQEKRENLSEQIDSLKIILPDFCSDFIWNLKQVKYSLLNFRYVYEKGKKAAIVFYPELRLSVIKQLMK